ncbi:radical SAM protein [bacterium]|nr:radical SAM protein [bacterium]
MHVFGPVPSRRLGRSLGINTIPPKHCSYACAYCQLGRTLHLTDRRRPFYAPDQLAAQVLRRMEDLAAAGDRADYLTIVSEGEPTLDSSLGELLKLLRPLDISTAVITNSSLLACAEVREELMQADWVSLKVDTVVEPLWKRINRPHGRIALDGMIEGMRLFAARFAGTLVTETMLVGGLTDGTESLERTASFLGTVKPAAAYLAVPTRPPAEPWVTPPSEERLGAAWTLFSAHVPNVEFLIGYEGDAFSSTGDSERDILSITAVHPLRRQAVEELIALTGESWQVVDRLLSSGLVRRTLYDGVEYYTRTLRRPGNDPALGVRTQ